ncbi:hypothetical protein EI94DRAFT_1702131 [Lactarius quietus]|nr:hypothetical protein EI94DRAFT_1702131 [Lactarius quietus]
MSIPDHNLTKEEETLHHYTATLKKRLEVYHACESRDENTWANEFKAFLKRNTSSHAPAVLEPHRGNQALRSNYYTAPSNLPPLDMHFNCQNASCQECMVSQTQDDSANTGGAEMNVPSAVCNPKNVLSQREELLVEATNVTVNIPTNVEKHYGAPSDKCKVVTRLAAKIKVAEWVETTAASASKGNARDDENLVDDPPQTRGRKAPRLQDKYRGTSAAKASFRKRTRLQVIANGKQTKKIDSQRHKSPNLENSCNESWQDEPVPVEESPSRRQDSRNEEGFLRAYYAVFCIWLMLITQAKGKDNDKTFKDLKLEVQALTVRCNEYERIIKDLQSARDTHKNILEMLWQQIVDLHDSWGTLSSAYGLIEHKQELDTGNISCDCISPSLSIMMMGPPWVSAAWHAHLTKLAAPLIVGQTNGPIHEFRQHGMGMVPATSDPVGNCHVGPCIIDPIVQKLSAMSMGPTHKLGQDGMHRIEMVQAPYNQVHSYMCGPMHNICGVSLPVPAWALPINGPAHEFRQHDMAIAPDPSNKASCATCMGFIDPIAQNYHLCHEQTIELQQHGLEMALAPSDQPKPVSHVNGPTDELRQHGMAMAVAPCDQPKHVNHVNGPTHELRQHGMAMAVAPCNQPSLWAHSWVSEAWYGNGSGPMISQTVTMWAIGFRAWMHGPM